VLFFVQQQSRLVNGLFTLLVMQMHCSEMTGGTTTPVNARLTVDIRQERTRVVSPNLRNYGGSIDEGLPPKMRRNR